MYLFYPSKPGIIDRLWQMVGKGKFWGRGAGEIVKGVGSKNTKAFGSGDCLSAVVDVELPVDAF